MQGTVEKNTAENFLINAKFISGAAISDFLISLVNDIYSISTSQYKKKKQLNTVFSL